uniref:DUF7880 domain-containing protein n=1 Tax=Chenopodium quinoa TaxID=63459 RepID=A0A803LYN6_CHEQI
MAATATTAHVSINRSFSNSIPFNQTKRAPRCALSPQNLKESRRVVSISLLLLHSFSSLPPKKSLEVDQPQYAFYRSFLRSGPAASFRSNIRAVAEYASDGGRGKTASDDVDRCLRAVDELDSLLLRASRNNGEASAKLMKEKISTAVNALDSLLQTVPTDVLDKSKAIADSYRNPDSNEVPEELDQDLKELQSIL